MKKLKYLLIICALALLSGCCKFETKINITKDKKVNLEIIYGIINVDAVDDEDDTDDISLTSTPSTDDITTCDDIKQSLPEGFKVEEWSDSSYKGCKITKSYSSIDDISGSEDVIVELLDNKEDKFLDGKLFKKVDDKYSAHFKMSMGSLLGSEDLIGDELTDDVKKLFVLKYEVNLPYKNLSNNATKVEKNGKRLIWNIDPSVDADIKYEFDFNGKDESCFPWLYVGIGCGALLVIVVIVVLARGNKCNCKECTCGCEAKEETKQVSKPTEDVVEEVVETEPTEEVVETEPTEEVVETEPVEEVVETEPVEEVINENNDDTKENNQ